METKESDPAFKMGVRDGYYGLEDWSHLLGTPEAKQRYAEGRVEGAARKERVNTVMAKREART